MNTLLKYLLLCLPLCACGGKNTETTNTDTTKTTQKIDYSVLAKQPLEPGSLRQAPTAELEQLIKNGLRVSLAGHQPELQPGMVTINSAALDTSQESRGYSTTNVQVQGVDEGDNVKYDGRYLYLATPTRYTDTGATASINIFATDAAAATATLVSKIALDVSQWDDVSELYLVGTEQVSTGLVTVRSSKHMNILENRSADLMAPIDTAQSIDIRLYDLHSPQQPNTSWAPTTAWSVSIDGDLLGSRKIGNKLYLISRFIPRLSTLNYAMSADTTINTEIGKNNEEVIRATPIEKLLPQYSINDASPQPLINKTGCLLPHSFDKNYGLLNIVNITTIDLSTQQLLNSECINSTVDGIYTSLNNIYLGGSANTTWDNWKSFTVIHKFAMTEKGVDYQASGSVEGVLSWRQPAFRMDEHNDYLRVVSSDYSQTGGPKHHLNVLQKVAGRSELGIIASLPNTAHPEPIGKPREDIYSVRFNGDSAYVVTFVRKDPLYAIDLSIPSDPKIAGELEIPGFSTYLHPINKQYLFALGNETDATGRQTGVKASLFDVRDITKPTLVGTHVFNDVSGWTNALYDHRAISFLQKNADQLRIVFPMTEVDMPFDGTSNNGRRSSLKLFEVNNLTSTLATFGFVGDVKAVPNYYFWSGNERGILHANAIFYIYGDTAQGSLWPLSLHP